MLSWCLFILSVVDSFEERLLPRSGRAFASGSHHPGTQPQNLKTLKRPDTLPLFPRLPLENQSARTPEQFAIDPGPILRNNRYHAESNSETMRRRLASHHRIPERFSQEISGWRERFWCGARRRTLANIHSDLGCVRQRSSAPKDPRPFPKLILGTAPARPPGPDQRSPQPSTQNQCVNQFQK